MEQLIIEAQKLGITIRDQRHIQCGIAVVNSDTLGCTLSYNASENIFYINTEGRWYFENEEANRFIKKFTALNDLMKKLNKEIKK